MNRGMYKQIEEFMLSCVRESAHDREHIYRVLRYAVKIADGLPDVDFDVLISAGAFA